MINKNILKKNIMDSYNNKINISKKVLVDVVNNWEDYINRYKDLKENGIKSIYDAFKHYILLGDKEGRIIQKYKNIELINDDFKKTYQCDFLKLYNEYDWDKYILINTDLHEIFINNNNNNNNIIACMHYIQCGIYENRIIQKKK